MNDLSSCTRPSATADRWPQAQRDYEYVRRGTANIFCIVAPKTGRHPTHATTNRKARRFAAC